MTRRSRPVAVLAYCIDYRQSCMTDSPVRQYTQTNDNHLHNLVVKRAHPRTCDVEVDERRVRGMLLWTMEHVDVPANTKRKRPATRSVACDTDVCAHAHT